MTLTNSRSDVCLARPHYNLMQSRRQTRPDIVPRRGNRRAESRSRYCRSGGWGVGTWKGIFFLQMHKPTGIPLNSPQETREDTLASFQEISPPAPPPVESPPEHSLPRETVIHTLSLLLFQSCVWPCVPRAIGSCSPSIAYVQPRRVEPLSRQAHPQTRPQGRFGGAGKEVRQAQV